MPGWILPSTWLGGRSFERLSGLMLAFPPVFLLASLLLVRKSALSSIASGSTDATKSAGLSFVANRATLEASPFSISIKFLVSLTPRSDSALASWRLAARHAPNAIEVMKEIAPTHSENADSRIHTDVIKGDESGVGRRCCAANVSL